MSLQKRLKLVIKDSDLSISDFAKKLGVAGNTFVNYREGRTSPTFDLLLKICEEFSVNQAWLLLGEGPMRAGAAPDPVAGPAPGIDIDLLRQILGGIKKGLALMSLVLPSDKEAELIALLYDHYAKTGESPEDKTVERYLRLVF